MGLSAWHHALVRERSDAARLEGFARLQREFLHLVVAKHLTHNKARKGARTSVRVSDY